MSGITDKQKKENLEILIKRIREIDFNKPCYILVAEIDKDTVTQTQLANKVDGNDLSQIFNDAVERLMETQERNVH